mgnify:FL=1
MDARRDWGHARDYVEAMWMMLQQDEPDDFVIATGEQHSVREFVQLAADELEIPLRFEGEGLDEKGITTDGRVIVEVEPRYFRPAEVETLLGDPSKAKEKLGWTAKTSFEDLVRDMARNDFKIAKREHEMAKD